MRVFRTPSCNPSFSTAQLQRNYFCKMNSSGSGIQYRYRFSTLPKIVTNWGSPALFFSFWQPWYEPEQREKGKIGKQIRRPRCIVSFLKWFNNRLRDRFRSDNDTTIEKRLYTRCIDKTTNEQELRYFKQSINRCTDHGNKVEIKFNATLKQVFLHLRIKETQ